MKRILLLVLPFALLGCKPPEDAAPRSSARQIQPDAVAHHVRILASDAMEGRGIGTKGLDAAATYIADEMKRSGLEPGGVDGTWFQPFEMTVGVRVGTNNTLALSSADGATTPLAFDRDWRPLAFSESGTVDAPIVFAGYGITAPELDWDDYAGIDAKGKIVLVLRHEPAEKDPHSKFAGAELTRYSELRVKAINARVHGAAGMILVNDTLAHPGEPETLVKVEPEGDAAFAGVVAIHLSRAGADRLVLPSGANMERLERALIEGGKPASQELAKSAAKITVDLEKTKKPVKNVIGVLRGVDAEMAKEATSDSAGAIRSTRTRPARCTTGQTTTPPARPRSSRSRAISDCIPTGRLGARSSSSRSRRKRRGSAAARGT